MTEKSRPVTKCGSVPKLTQVGEESILTALERMVFKELGNLTPYVRNKGALPPSGEGRREAALGTVYQKHRSVLTRKEDVYRLTPARCRNVKEVGQPFGVKLTTEAPVNGGRNYDGPKVAKFLVG